MVARVASLAQLQTFLAIYRLGSLTAAAGSLHLSQPAVSAHLRVLETEEGRPLFVRLARGVSPTQVAHALARDISPHLDALQGARDRLRDRTVGGTVHLGGPADMLAAKALPSLAGVVAGGTRIRVRTGIAEHLIELLGGDELDLVIATRHQPRGDVVFEPLFDETLVLVANAGWASRLPGAAIEREPLLALDGVPLVAFDEQLPLIRRFWKLVFGATIEVAATITVADLRAVCAAVAAGAGIGVVPKYLATTALRHGELVELIRPSTPPANSIYLAYRPTALMRSGVESVRQRLTDTAPTWEQRD
jgi:DNA-binding transcriptional LysR family regulator